MYRKSVMHGLSPVVLLNKPITFLTSSLPLLSPLLRHSVPPLFFDQTEAFGAEKCLLETAPPPYLRVWMTAFPLISSSGSGTEACLVCFRKTYFSTLEKSWHSLPRCFHKVTVLRKIWCSFRYYNEILLWTILFEFLKFFIYSALTKNCLESMFLDYFGMAFKLTLSGWEMLYLTSKDMVRTLLTR